MAQDRFGNIKIDRGSPSEDGPEVPVEKDNTSQEKGTSPEVTVSKSATKQDHFRRRKRHLPSFTLPLPSKRVIAWLSLVPLLVILYGVTSYFLVPVFFKGILVSRISSEFQRPVEIGRVVFSPFNMELRIDALTVGPQQGNVGGKDLVHLENGHFNFTLKKIFQGKLVCSRADIDDFEINMVRQKDSIFDLKSISNFLLSGANGQQDQYWPVWLSMDEIKILNGRVHIDDRVAKKVFTIEQILLYIPSAETRVVDKAAVPKLSAVVDSSPFEINAVRLQNQTGAWSTGFSFEFRSVILNKFRDILPLPESGFQLSDGEADMSLDFILPEIQQGTDGVVVEGETALRNIQWHDPETQAVITLPEGKILYRIIPSEQLFRFINVEFYEPEIILKKNKNFKKENPYTYFYTVFSKILRAEESLVVESFLLNNGKLVIAGDAKSGSKYVWNDVTLAVQGLSTAGHRTAHALETGPASYTLRARDISSKPVSELYSEGELNVDAALKGNLKVTGLNMDRYSGFLPETPLTLKKGTSDISFYFEYDGYTDQNAATFPILNKVFSGKFKTTEYVLNKGRKQAVAGKELFCEEFHFDTNSRTVVCEKLELSKSDIYPEFIFNKDTDKSAGKSSGWDFLVNDLAMAQSTVYLPLHESEKDKKNKSTQLVIKNLEGEMTSLQSEDPAKNIKATGGIDKNGKIAVSGGYSYRTGKGSLQLELTGMDLSILKPYYSSWLVPEVKKGLFGFSGTLQLPDKEFKGKAGIDNFMAQTAGGAVVKFEHVSAGNLEYQAEPVNIQIGELKVRKPSVKSGLSSGEGPLRTYLDLKSDQLPESVGIRLIRLEEGSFDMPEPIIYPGYQPMLSKVNGTLAFVDGSKIEFMLDGQINGQGLFDVKGSSSFREIHGYELQTENFSLVPFFNVLKKDVGFGGQQASAYWKQKMNKQDSTATVNTMIRIKDVVPDLSSPSSPILSLLIDTENSFAVEFSEKSSAGQPQPFLLEQFVTRLNHLQVKAALSPTLVLNEEGMSLDLVQTVSFASGRPIPETELTSLSTYLKLLNMRPYVMLSVQGQYDQAGDHDFIQAALQSEEDRQREIENKRRALEKVRILQREKKKLKEMKAAAQQGEVIEEIIPSESNEGLEPLPRKLVKVDNEVLVQLARQRAQTVRDFLVQEIKIDPHRIRIDTQVAQGSPSVKINIVPYEPVEKGKNDDSSTR